MAVRDRRNRRYEALDRRVDALRDGGADPVRADDDAGPGAERPPIPGAADDSGDGAAAIPYDVGHGDAEAHLGAGRGRRVDDDGVEYGARRHGRRPTATG